MSFFWRFSTSGASFSGQLKCWPVTPGSIRIEADDGNPSTKKVLIDDGVGGLSGDGFGTVRYDFGIVEFDFSGSLPESGTPIRVSYEPIEGGCATNCEKCLTNKIRLDISTGTITGQGEIAIHDAWVRLLDKIKANVLPLHVELVTDKYSEEFIVYFCNRFDIVNADEISLDIGDGRELRTEFDA